MSTLIISTSPRENSNTLKVATYLNGAIAAKGETVKLISFRTLRLRSVGDGYLKREELGELEKSILADIAAATKIIWIIPEYNRDVPVEFSGFIHHFGTKEYPELWNDKVHYVVGVSSGFGGREPIYQFAKVFNYLINSIGGKNCHVSPYHYQSMQTGDQFDEQGNPQFNETYAKGMAMFVDKLFW